MTRKGIMKQNCNILLQSITGFSHITGRLCTRIRRMASNQNEIHGGISRSISKILCSVACRCVWKLFATSGFNNYHLSPVLYCIVPDRDKSSMIERYWHDTHTGARCVRKKKYIILQRGELACFHFFYFHQN
jgi:hypothetical protein